MAWCHHNIHLFIRKRCLFLFSYTSIYDKAKTKNKHKYRVDIIHPPRVEKGLIKKKSGGEGYLTPLSLLRHLCNHFHFQWYSFSRTSYIWQKIDAFVHVRVWKERVSHALKSYIKHGVSIGRRRVVTKRRALVAARARRQPRTSGCSGRLAFVTAESWVSTFLCILFPQAC